MKKFKEAVLLPHEYYEDLYRDSHYRPRIMTKLEEAFPERQETKASFRIDLEEKLK